MSTPAPVVFVDDEVARAFEPFAQARPLCECRAGGMSIRERWMAALRRSDPTTHFVAAPVLEHFHETGSAVAAPDVLPAGTIVINSRALPLLPASSAVASAAAGIWRMGNALAALRLHAPTPRSTILEGLDAVVAAGAVGTGVVVAVEGRWLTGVWDLVATLPTLLPGDIAWAAAVRGLTEAPTEPGVLRTGSHPVWMEGDARVEAGAFLDCSAGPILLEAGSVVQAFTRLVGPAWIGTGSLAMGSRVSVVSVGPQCRVSGEASHLLMFGYANKGHDGFVGHSVLGRWVNLGAGTITSNLKNTYGTVSLWTPHGVVDTGQQFLGTLFGDHAKTGIGLRLTTGCVVGTGANCYDAMPPKVVPPFAWGSGAPYDTHALDKFLVTAERMMARRGQLLTTNDRAHWARVHQAHRVSDG
jgi:UDP-N-acetylglucosamine diphosphorylase/glucosamine-1-phosphate N-acetyltransferase